MYYIYGLSEKVNGRIMYVGKTRNPKQRLGSHCSPMGDNTKLYFWLRELIKKGEVPKMKILQKCLEKNAKKAEATWIKKCKGRNKNLLNVALLPNEVVEEFNKKRKIESKYQTLTLKVQKEVINYNGGYANCIKLLREILERKAKVQKFKNGIKKNNPNHAI